MEGDPAITGRWGPSVVLVPSGDVAVALDELTEQAFTLAGPGHWASGTLGAAHFTVRALERFGTPTRPGQISALERAAREPVTIEVTGIRMTDAAVLASATSVGGSADRLRQHYAAELGEDAWLEDAVLPARRAVWYATLLHVAAPIGDPDALTRWVAERATLPIGVAVFHEVRVCDWRFDERRMVPDIVATVPLR